MSNSIKNLYQFRTKTKILKSSTTDFEITEDVYNKEAVSLTGAYIVLRNRTGTKVEIMKGDATGGTFTITQRGIGSNGDASSDRNQERSIGTLCKVVLVESQIFDKDSDSQTIDVDITYSGDTEFTKSMKFPVYADATARDTGIPTPSNGMMIYNTALGLVQQYVSGAWVNVDTGTGVSNASTTVAGKTEIATDAEIVAETDTGGTGAKLVVTPSQLSPTKLTEKASIAGDDLFRIADSEDTNKAKSVKPGTIIDESYSQLGERLYFGDGSDGDVTISTNTTLTEDKYYNNLTINSGVIFDPAGYKVYVKGKFTNNTTISRNGNDGSNGGNASLGSGGTAGTGGAVLNSGTLGHTFSGGNGGAGSSGSSGGSAGVSGESASPSYSENNGANGGKGGNSSFQTQGGNGGVGGVSTRGEFYNTVFSLTKILEIIATPVTGKSLPINDAYMSSGTSGGGGGGGARGDGAGGGGGGGGSNGGIIWIACKEFDNQGTIESNGGDGGNGGNGYNDSQFNDGGGGGGGGGGNGGTIFILYHTMTELGTTSVSSGNFGTGGTGINSGANGQNGNAGEVIQVQV